MKYYLYHIPGKKIGVTCDIYNRVTDQQGYEADEYEILEMSDDIDYISNREIELQKEKWTQNIEQVEKMSKEALEELNKLKEDVEEKLNSLEV